MSAVVLISRLETLLDKLREEERLQKEEEERLAKEEETLKKVEEERLKKEEGELLNPDVQLHNIFSGAKLTVKIWVKSYLGIIHLF